MADSDPARMGLPAAQKMQSHANPSEPVGEIRGFVAPGTKDVGTGFGFRLLPTAPGACRRGWRRSLRPASIIRPLVEYRP